MWGYAEQETMATTLPAGLFSDSRRFLVGPCRISNHTTSCCSPSILEKLGRLIVSSFEYMQIALEFGMAREPVFVFFELGTIENSLVHKSQTVDFDTAGTLPNRLRSDKYDETRALIH